MIKPTQKKLTIIFTVIIIICNAFVLVISFNTLNRSIIKSLQDNLNHDVKVEYLPYVRSGDFKTLEDMKAHDFFQVFNRAGQIVSGTYKFLDFDLPLNSELFDKAFSGKQQYETVRYHGERYLVSYIPTNRGYISRAAMPLTGMIEYEKNFVNLVTLIMPLMLIVSFFVSRYLVKQAMKPIADVFAFQENFSANVTHELRSPLASIKGNLEVTLRRVRSMDEYRETLRLGLKEVDRVIGMINNLYMLASSKFRPLDLVKKEANLKLIIEEILESHRTDISAKAITIDTSGLTDVVCSYDDTLMRRAIENLSDNAIKYTPHGGVIRVGVSREGHRLSLTISNTCYRIDRNEMKNFFEPFYRGDNAISRSVEGKGLGLYITRYIIRSHGGEVTMKVMDDYMCIIEIYYELSSFKFMKLNPLLYVKI
ncbi:MAG: sensor histidine kinase [Dissulfurispiraceae bacterium]|jgi:signal transduction histidine kinase